MLDGALMISACPLLAEADIRLECAVEDPAFPSSYWMHAGCSAFGPFAVPYRRFQMLSRNAATG
jgi:hypothetical protein